MILRLICRIACAARLCVARVCTALVCVVALGAASPVHAQTASPGAAAPGRALALLELRDAVYGGDPAKLRVLAFSELPAGATNATIDLYSGAMMSAAFALNELAQAEVILRRWLQLNPSNTTPRFMLLTMLAQGVGTQIEEALAMGAATVGAAQFPTEKVTSRAALAELHLRVGDHAQAAQVLGEARTVVEGELRNFGTGGPRAYFVPYAQFTYHLADCRLALARLRLDAAEAACRQSLAAMRTAWSYRRMVPPVQHIAAATRLAEAQLVLAEVLLARNQHFDAETAVAQTLAEARTNGANPYLRFQADDLIWRIRMAQGDLTPLRQMRAEVLKAATDAGISATSLGFVSFRRNIQTGLVLIRDWPAALAEFDRADALLARAEPQLRQAARNVVPRALTWYMGGRHAQVTALLGTELPASVADFGADHARTALLRGLRAMSAAAGAGGATLLAAQVNELARAAQVLMDPAAPGAEQLERSELALARQMVLQAFVDLAADSGDAGHATLAFRAADALRVSSVQQAVNDAAVRAAASTQGLADVVRRDQDARNELQALYDFIAGQAAELEPQRRDGVVAQMKARIAQLQTQRAQTRADIARQFPQYDRLVRPQPTAADAVAAQLKAGEVFVSLLPTQRHVHVWAVAPGTAPRYHRAALDEAALQALVSRLRRTLDVAGEGERAPAFDTAAASALYGQLMRPVLGDAAPRHLVVSAAGALSQIPFAVLLRQPMTWADARAAAAAPWLIRDSAISHTASASAWLASRAGRSPGGAMSLAAWADPLFDRAGTQGTSKIASTGPVRALQLTRHGGAAASSAPASASASASGAPGTTPGATPGTTSGTATLAPPAPAVLYSRVPPLPETRDEVAAIARSLGADAQRDVLYGEQATRESVLQASRSGTLATRRVIVFATHGLVAGDLPNLTQPALAMAATGRESQEPLAPLLTLQDVLTLRLDADWVVLSACNTAAADGRAGEALSGLARGFFYAGGRSLLVTHWAVESDSATLLTTGTFAHQAANPGAPRAESLRQAMLKVMAQPRYAHPAFWAPYALVGEGG